MAPGERLLDERLHLEGAPPIDAEQEVLVRQRPRDPVRSVGLSSRSSIRSPTARPGRRRPVRSPDRSSRPWRPRAASRCRVQGDVVRHDHVRAAADPHPRDVDPFEASMSSSSISVAGLTTTPLPITDVCAGRGRPTGTGGA